jgi:hypothetical protein
MQQCLDGDCLRQEASVKIQYAKKLLKLLDSLGMWASLQMHVFCFQLSGTFCQRHGNQERVPWEHGRHVY